jgi:ABC-type Fe3+-citrate transport system substrate-binding protein
MSIRDGEPVWFYELHEGDDDVYSDVLLAHDAEYDEQELLELVLEARTAVLESYTEDTLSEAIANELAKRHGFLVVDDTQLRVAVNVSAQEGETAVANVDLGPVGRDDDDDHRSILIDVEPEERLWGTD